MALHKDLTGADLHVNKLHAPTHLAGGTDPLVLAESQITALTTDLAAKVVGPAAAIDNAIVRADGTTGKLVQDSSVIIDDAGNVGIGTEEFTNDLLYPWGTGGTVTTKTAIKGLTSGNGDLFSVGLLLLDSSDRPVASLSNTGRMDLVDYSGQGAVAVLYNRGAAANDELAGHYAFGAKNSAGEMNTVATISATVSDITETDMSSKMSFVIMSHKDTSAGYSQPNMGMFLDENGLSIPGTLTIGATLVSTAGLALIDDATATVQIATLGLDADIATLALPANTTISAAGAELINDANAAAQLATLGTAAYSEGTWTPVLTGFTIVGAAPAASGIYKRIGNMVFITCTIVAGAGGNVSVASTILTSTITGLPFTVAGSAVCVATDDGIGNDGTGKIATNGTGTIYVPTISAKTIPIFISGTYSV